MRNEGAPLRRGHALRETGPDQARPGWKFGRRRNGALYQVVRRTGRARASDSVPANSGPGGNRIKKQTGPNSKSEAPLTVSRSFCAGDQTTFYPLGRTGGRRRYRRSGCVAGSRQLWNGWYARDGATPAVVRPNWTLGVPLARSPLQVPLPWKRLKSEEDKGMSPAG